MCNYRHPGPRRAWEVGSEPPFLHHFDRSGRSRRSGRDSKSVDFAVIYNDLALARSPNRAWHPMGLPHGPPGAQGVPNGPQRCPKTAKGTSKAGQRGLKAPQREPIGQDLLLQLDRIYYYNWTGSIITLKKIRVWLETQKLA